MEESTIPMTSTSVVLRGMKGLVLRGGNQHEQQQQLLSSPGNVRNLEEENTSFLVLLTVIVVFVVLFYAICTFHICRHWLFHSCCGGRFADSRFAGRTRVLEQQLSQQQNEDGTILVHAGQVLTLTGEQRRAVLEVIFAGPETTKAVEEIDVANKRKRKRDRRRRNEDDIHQKNGAKPNEHGDDADSTISRDDDLPENVEIPTIFTNQTAPSEASPPQSTTTETDLDETETNSCTAADDTTDLDTSNHSQQSEKEQSYHTLLPSGGEGAAALDTFNHPADHVKDTTGKGDCCSHEEDDIIIHQVDEEESVTKPPPSRTILSTTHSPVNSSVHTPAGSFESSSPGDFEGNSLQHIVLTPIRADLEIYHSESQSDSCIGKSDNSVAADSPTPENVGTPTANDFDTPTAGNQMFRVETLETLRTTDSDDTPMTIECNGPTFNETEGPTLAVPTDDSLDLPLFQPLAMRRKWSYPIPEDMSVDENAGSTDEESKMEIESIGEELTDDAASIESSQALLLENPVPLTRRDSFTTVTSFSTLVSEYTDGDSTEGNVCPICLNGYHKGEMLIVSKHCTHMFHKDCIFEWLEKHDECPICRSTMMTDSDVSKAATTLVGKTRMYRAVTTSLPQRLQQQQQQSRHLSSVRQHHNSHLSSRNVASTANQQHHLGNVPSSLLPDAQPRPRPQHSHHLSPFQHRNHHVPIVRNARNQQHHRVGRESSLSMVAPIPPAPHSPASHATTVHPTTVGRAAAAAAAAATDSSPRRAATTTTSSLGRPSSTAAGEIRDP